MRGKNFAIIYNEGTSRTLSKNPELVVLDGIGGTLFAVNVDIEDGGLVVFIR